MPPAKTEVTVAKQASLGSIEFEECGVLGPEPAELLFRLSLDPGSRLADEFRVVRSKVRDIGQERPFRCFGIGSATAGEGKTAIAVGLSMALARGGGRVLLLEADLRKRSLADRLAIVPEPGLSEWLDAPTGKVPVHRLTSDGPLVLFAGTAPPRDPEALGSSQMSRMIRASRDSFDYVVVDCAPFVPVADTVLLQDLLDGYVCVVRARHAPRETISRGLGQLKPGRIAGVVFNDYHEILTRYYTEGYRRYGDPFR